MNLLILISLIATSAICVVNGYEFESLKLNQRWDDITPIKSQYEFKSLKLNQRWNDVTPIESQTRAERSDQFYEGIFSARIDHFRPQDQRRVDFVRI